jgi:hypothetical protein
VGLITPHSERLDMETIAAIIITVLVLGLCVMVYELVKGWNDTSGDGGIF